MTGNTDGVEKVRASNGKFIFIMENSTAAFWMNQEPCDLEVVGKPITNRQYGFATNKGRGALNDKISDAIRKLKVRLNKLLYITGSLRKAKNIVPLISKTQLNLS